MHPILWRAPGKTNNGRRSAPWKIIVCFFSCAINLCGKIPLQQAVHLVKSGFERSFYGELTAFHHILVLPTNKFVNLCFHFVLTTSQPDAMKKLFLFVLFPAILVILPGLAFSQTIMKLSGTVSDSSKSLAFVTVRIFKNNNTKPLQTTL